MSPAERSTGAAEAGAQLFLISPPAPAPERFAGDLDAALAEGGIAGFLLRVDALEQRAGLAPPLQQVCRERGVAFLIQDDLQAALDLGADGLHVTATATVGAARASLGPERIVGAGCGSSRHAAMLAGEDGADYVGFGTVERSVDEELIELVDWWSGIFVLPVLALGALGPEGTPPLVWAGADFLGVGDAVWRHPEGSAAGVRAMREAITSSMEAKAGHRRPPDPRRDEP